MDLAAFNKKNYHHKIEKPCTISSKTSTIK
jgi:hypothetical protein